MDLEGIKAAGGAEKGASVWAYEDHVCLIRGRICWEIKFSAVFIALLLSNIKLLNLMHMNRFSFQASPLALAK